MFSIWCQVAGAIDPCFFATGARLVGAVVVEQAVGRREEGACLGGREGRASGGGGGVPRQRVA